MVWLPANIWLGLYQHMILFWKVDFKTNLQTAFIWLLASQCKTLKQAWKGKQTFQYSSPKKEKKKKTTTKNTLPVCLFTVAASIAYKGSWVFKMNNTFPNPPGEGNKSQNKILLGSLSPSLWLCLWKRYNLLVSPNQENAVVCNFCNQRFAQCADGKLHCFGTSGTFGFSKLFTLSSETFVRILILPISCTMLSNSTRLN